MSRVAVQAYGIAQPAVKNYVQAAAKGAVGRMATDFGFQLGTGYIAADPSRGSKMGQAFAGVNGTSILAAGVINTQDWSEGAKFLMALGSSATTNLVSVSTGNKAAYGGYWHMADLSNKEERGDYAVNVMLGVAFDQTKEHASDWLGKQTVRLIDKYVSPATAGEAGSALTKWVTESRVTWTSGLIVGGTPETIKKQADNKKAAAAEDVKKRQPKRAAPPPHK